MKNRVIGTIRLISAIPGDTAFLQLVYQLVYLVPMNRDHDIVLSRQGKHLLIRNDLFPFYICSGFHRIIVHKTNGGIFQQIQRHFPIFPGTKDYVLPVRPDLVIV